MILITGASGNAGHALSQLLARRKVPIRMAHSSGAPSPRDSPEDLQRQTVRLDLTDPSTFAAALNGCDSVFLMRPPAISETRQTPNLFIDLARQSGLRHLVSMSVMDAGRHSWIPHHATQMYLRAGPRDWTILQPAFFAQNQQGPYLKDIRDDHRIYLPAGSGQVAFIDLRDIAPVAAPALSEPDGHLGLTYSLSGPSAMGFDKVAALLSAQLDHLITYERTNMLAYAMHLYRQRLPWMQFLTQTALHVGQRFGHGAQVTQDIPQLLGQDATPLEPYIRDHALLWQSPLSKNS